MKTAVNQPAMTARLWLALLVLALSTFTIVTTELAPVGLLTPIANGLHASESEIGLTVSLYAWVGAISALLASVFLGNLPKKILLLALTLVLLVSNLWSASVDSFSMLLAARVVGALAHGAFWAMIGATAVAIVPARYLGTATSIVFGGVSAASVFGVPLSNYIGQHAGWRQAFWLMSLLSAIAFVGMLWAVPKIKTSGAVGAAALKNVLRSATLWKIYLATLLAIAAHFAAFTFIEPWLQSQPALSAGFIPLALLIYGLAGLAGNVLTGIMIDRHLKTTVALSVLLAGAVLIMLGAQATLSRPLVLVAMLLWGVAVSGIFVGFQTWVLRTAGDQAFAASALYVAFFNAAIGAGALLGAWLVSVLSLPALLLTAGVAIALSLLLVVAIPAGQPLAVSGQPAHE